LALSLGANENIKVQWCVKPAVRHTHLLTVSSINQRHRLTPTALIASVLVYLD